MALVDWQPGTPISSPVYLDSGVLIAAFVINDARYPKATALLGELLASQAHILLSVLTLAESQWILAKLSYIELFRQPSRANWNSGIYAKHCEAIFQAHGARMRAVHNLIRDWTNAGIRIDVVPVGNLQGIAAAVPHYMRALRMKSSDAVHLATAERQASSLITTDSEFLRVTGTAIDIVHIAP